ncbi:unnamed protein product [Anisakis simplex]|uniref:G_PROTEIN_RECEP_F1_2 domain-containing protein n=1 Tax=Anisakis simplex TaxID=6269 RepID=A0A0M3K098_ANISI|nr:unnamed protein product [Anisakis simplex]
MVIGLVGNGGVLFAVSKNKRLRSARNIFLLNLILTDILLCVTAIPVTPWYALAKDWQFGALMCRLMPLSNSCSVFVTSWSLTAIALDKFVHIINPTRAPVRIRQAALITLFIWLICSLINIPYLMSYDLVDGAYYVPENATPFCGHFCDELNWQGETPRRLYGSTVMLLQFVVPLAIITYCYSRILEKVAKDMIVQNAQFSGSLSTAQRIEATQRKKRVNYILIGMVVAFIGCWLPLTAVNLVKDFSEFFFVRSFLSLIFSLRKEPNLKSTRTIKDSTCHLAKKAAADIVAIAGKEPEFLERQPFLWPLVAHVIAMSTVIWNPLLFFWLTRKRKRPLWGRIIASSDVLSSFLSRISSIRRNSAAFRAHSPTETKVMKRQKASDATPSRTRPLLVVENNRTMRSQSLNNRTIL